MYVWGISIALTMTVLQLSKTKDILYYLTLNGMQLQCEGLQTVVIPRGILACR